ncbi:uncharacterized protein TNCV_3900691 [Trichonephila clavipes]|nr:uncharacterized protein TNCV_3900691 [Trichonephila clavipes]
MTGVLLAPCHDEFRGPRSDDVRQLVQSSKYGIDADFDHGNERNNAASVPTSSEMRNILKIVGHRNREAKTRHRVSLVSAHVTTFEEDLKQQPLCQDNPKDVLSDSGLRSSWPFHSFQTVILQIPLNNPSSVRSCIIIHQNEVVTNSSSIWADIWIKGLIPISKTSYGSSMEHMQVSVATERDPCPNDSTTSITVSFNSGFDGI